MSIRNIDLIEQYLRSCAAGKNTTVLKSDSYERDFEGKLNKIMGEKPLNTREVKKECTNSNLKTSEEMEEIFVRASEKYEVPLELLKAMAKAESNFNPNAVSRCGAAGVMQLMPATAKALGVTDSFDPEQNIMGGANYISQKIKAYNGDITLALAAYNAGSGNVAKYGGVPPFAETQNYIKKIYGFMGEDIKIPDGVYNKKSENNHDGLVNKGYDVSAETENQYLLAQMQILRHRLDMQSIFAMELSDSDRYENSEKDSADSLERNMFINMLGRL